MTEKRAEVFTGLLFTFVTAVAVSYLVVRLHSLDLMYFGAVVEIVLGVILVSVVTWALFHHRVTSLLFRPPYEPSRIDRPGEGLGMPALRSLEEALSQGPR